MSAAGGNDDDVPEAGQPPPVPADVHPATDDFFDKNFPGLKERGGVDEFQNALLTEGSGAASGWLEQRTGQPTDPEMAYTLKQLRIEIAAGERSRADDAASMAEKVAEESGQLDKLAGTVERTSQESTDRIVAAVEGSLGGSQSNPTAVAGTANPVTVSDEKVVAIDAVQFAALLKAARGDPRKISIDRAGEPTVARQAVTADPTERVTITPAQYQEMLRLAGEHAQKVTPRLLDRVTGRWPTCRRPGRACPLRPSTARLTKHIRDTTGDRHERRRHRSSITKDVDGAFGSSEVGWISSRPVPVEAGRGAGSSTSDDNIEPTGDGDRLPCRQRSFPDTLRNCHLFVVTTLYNPRFFRKVWYRPTILYQPALTLTHRPIARAD